MIRNNYLLPTEGIAPFLMASGAACELESAAAEDCEDLVRVKAWGRAFTQPPPQRASHRAPDLVRTAPGRAGSPLQYSGSLLLPFPQQARARILQRRSRSTWRRPN